MLEAYLDESGTHGGSRLLSVAAVVAEQDQWIAFSQVWKMVLGDIECFHARERRCASLKPKLAELMRHMECFGVVVSVDPRDFRSAAGAALTGEFGNAYANCVFLCTYYIHQWTLANYLGPAVFVIEDGADGLKKVMQVLRRMKITNNRDSRMRIAGVLEAQKKDFRGLQAADFLAHSRSTNRRKWLDELAPVIKHDFVWQPDQIAATSKYLMDDIREKRAERRAARKGKK